MKVLDLFSGIGGFSLGLEAAGMQTVAFCEQDEFCQKVLRKHWPDVPIYDDIRKVDYDGRADLICGGWPCQPFSLSGHQRGAEDDRHLWPEMLTVIERYKPRWFLGENVANVTNMGLEQVLSDLESAGYQCQAFIIPACAIGALHRRDRCWIFAHSGGLRREANAFGKQFWAMGLELSKLYSQLATTSSGPTYQPTTLRGNHGVSLGLDKHRIKALGNAVVPQLVEIFGRAIMRADR